MKTFPSYRSFASCSLLLAAAVAAGGSFLACSGGSNASGPPPLGEHTGGIVMKLTDVPNDVQCVELDTSDYRNPQVRVDVTPGSTATIPIAPLDPGYVWLSGQAYGQSCESLNYGYGDAGVGDVTWVADGVSVNIIAGQYTQTDMHFHQLGGASVNVQWDTCDAGGSFYNCGGGDDAGPPPPPDASCPPTGLCPVGCSILPGPDGCAQCVCVANGDAGTTTPPHP